GHRALRNVVVNGLGQRYALEHDDTDPCCRERPQHEPKLVPEYEVAAYRLVVAVAQVLFHGSRHNAGVAYDVVEQWSEALLRRNLSEPIPIDRGRRRILSKAIPGG